MFLNNAVFFGAILFLPLWLQRVGGPTAVGWALTPLLVGYTVGTLVSGALMGRVHRVGGLATGWGLVAVVACLALGFVSPGDGWTPLVLAALGWGLGGNIPLFSLAAQNSVAPRHLGLATATNGFFRNLGGALGTSAFGSLFFSGGAGVPPEAWSVWGVFGALALTGLVGLPLLVPLRGWGPSGPATSADRAGPPGP